MSFPTNRRNLSYALIGILAVILLVVYGSFDPASHFFPPCPFRRLTGLSCPGCGSQRAIHQLLHGDIRAAFRYNPMLLPGLAYVAAGMFLQVRADPASVRLRQRYFGRHAAWSALFILLGYWILRNIIGV